MLLQFTRLPASGSSPGACPISSHFTPFPCAIGTLPASALLLDPRMGGFLYILKPCWPFKWQKSGSFFHHPNPYWFLQPEVMGIYLPSAGTLGSVVWPRAGITHSQRHPSHLFHCCHLCLSAVHDLSTPLSNSAPPTSLDESVFFKTLVVGPPYSSIF